MDGNGRWAKKRGLPRIFGHRAGVKAVQRIVEAASTAGLEVLTLYAFSTENWARPKGEVSGLMGILKKYLRAELPTMMKNNVRMVTIGDRAKLPPAVRQELEDVMEKTRGNTGMVLNMALNYGGRQEIVRAVQRCQADGVPIDEQAITDHLDTAGLPDPDLFIRTSGEMRISNLLLWQMAYTELYVTPVLWPDFSSEDLHDAIAVYRQRERRYGGI
jgi:undecaprenyl diphosphate synthase